MSLLATALILALGASQTPIGEVSWPSNDPIVHDADELDSRRPLVNELRTTVGDGFTLALAGDLIIARPLLQAPHTNGFDSLLGVLRKSDVAFGNFETTAIDIRHFRGAPYPFDGDWTNVSLPTVAKDIKDMGFNMVGRANNHVMDWGLEGMQETDAHLDEAGIIHAGSGDSLAFARAPEYFESAKGRVALVSFATTFRPTTDAMPPHGQAPGRAGLSAIHLHLKVHVTEDAMRALAGAVCALDHQACKQTPETLTLAGTTYVRDVRDFNEYSADPEDLKSIGRAIREAKQHADFVLAAIHAHECDWECDTATGPQLPGEFLKAIARGAIDAGADAFAATGIHNLGPIEIYKNRPIFYGLANFFWSDIQEPVPHELFEMNRATLSQIYVHPERATDYDLTAALNSSSFANEFTFQSVLAQVQFARGRLSKMTLYPVWLGYGENLRTSGTPRLETDPDRARQIFQAIAERTRAYGLPDLKMTVKNFVATVVPLE